MANTSGEKELNTNYPVTEGLTAGTTKLRKKAHLEAETDLTYPKDEVGL